MKIECTTEPGGAMAMLQAAVAQDPAWRPPSKKQPLAAFVRDAEGKVVGGALATVQLPAVKVDVLWLPTELRGRRLADAAVGGVEAAAAAAGATFAYCSTLSYQAPGFYAKRGYQMIASNHGSPRHDDLNHIMSKKLEIQPAEDTEVQTKKELADGYVLDVTTDIAPEDLKVIEDGLNAHNASIVDPTGGLPSATWFALLRTDEDVVVGGAYASQYWGRLSLAYIFVPPELRRQGHALNMIHALEEAAGPLEYGVEAATKDHYLDDGIADALLRKAGFVEEYSLPGIEGLPVLSRSWAKRPAGQ